MVDRREKSGAEKLGELPSVDPIAVPGFQQGVLARIADHQFRYVRLEQELLSKVVFRQ